jgi:hypothetical protein
MPGGEMLADPFADPMVPAVRSASTEWDLTAGPLRMRLSAQQLLHVGWDEPSWLGPGELLGPAFAEGATVVSPHEVTTPEGDATAITLASGSLRADVRACSQAGIAVLRFEAPDGLAGIATREFAHPRVAWRFDTGARVAGDAPVGLRGFGYQYTEFAYPVFADDALAIWRLLPFRPAVVMPLGLIAPDGRALLLAPLNNFHEHAIAVPASRDDLDAGIRVGWHGDLDHVDAGFASDLVLIPGDGARDCLERWAALLRARSGVEPPARDSDTLGTRLSYWTDNGSAYWYRTEPGHDVESGLVATVEDLDARGVRVGAVQLDSWWYPHEVLRPFDTDEWVVPPTGMVAWEPRADVLPEGVAALRERLGRLPLVAHCRHLSSSSPYVDGFPCWVDADRAHPQTTELYERLLDQAVAWGIETFEHDWLVECFLGVRGLREANGRAASWQDGIDAALAARGLTAQWCMATPADFANTSRLSRVTSIRTSGDHGYLVGPEVLWPWFLYTNTFARALGMWPYKDVFRSATSDPHREVDALLATLSAGPVGIGDPLGAADPALIRRVARADGLLVRPDVPIAATDQCFATPAALHASPLLSTAYTQHTSGRWGYVVALNVGRSDARLESRVALPMLGDDRPDADTIVYDWRTGTCAQVLHDGSYHVSLDQFAWDLRILAPVLPGEIAVFGDPQLYASAGDARIADVRADDERIDVTVLGAPGERLTVAGWSAREPRAHTWTPTRGDAPSAISYDRATELWRAAVEVPLSGWLVLRLPNAG